MSGVCRKRVEMVWDTSGVPNGLLNPSIQKLIIINKINISAIPNFDPAAMYALVCITFSFGMLYLTGLPTYKISFTNFVNNLESISHQNL